MDDIPMITALRKRLLGKHLVVISPKRGVWATACVINVLRDPATGYQIVTRDTHGVAKSLLLTFFWELYDRGEITVHDAAPSRA